MCLIVTELVKSSFVEYLEAVEMREAVFSDISSILLATNLYIKCNFVVRNRLHTWFLIIASKKREIIFVLNNRLRVVYIPLSEVLNIFEFRCCDNFFSVEKE